MASDSAHPHRQFDLAAVQRQVGNLARGLRDAAQRCQCPPDDDDPGGGRGNQRDHGDDPEDDQHPHHRGVDVGHRQTGDDDVAAVAARGGDDTVAAQAVEVQGHRLAAVGDRCQLVLRGRGQRGPGTAAGQVAGVDRLAVADHRRDHAGRLARRIEEPGTGARPRIDVLVMPPARSRFGVHQRRAVRGAAELPVELRHQVVEQRQLGRRGDADTDEGQHDDLPDQQPQPKRPDPRRV